METCERDVRRYHLLHDMTRVLLTRIQPIPDTVQKYPAVPAFVDHLSLPVLRCFLVASRLPSLFAGELLIPKMTYSELPYFVQSRRHANLLEQPGGIALRLVVLGQVKRDSITLIG